MTDIDRKTGSQSDAQQLHDLKDVRHVDNRLQEEIHSLREEQKKGPRHFSFVDGVTLENYGNGASCASVPALRSQTYPDYGYFGYRSYRPLYQMPVADSTCLNHGVSITQHNSYAYPELSEYNPRTQTWITEKTLGRNLLQIETERGSNKQEWDIQVPSYSFFLPDSRPAHVWSQAHVLAETKSQLDSEGRWHTTESHDNRKGGSP